LIITLKILKYLKITLNDEVKDLYTKNYKMLLKEIEQDIRKCMGK
jgi:hypothetical protein